MKEYQESVVEELRHLRGQITKLRAFLDCDALFSIVDNPGDVQDLEKQLDLMVSLEHVMERLASRINK